MDNKNIQKSYDEIVLKKETELEKAVKSSNDEVLAKAIQQFLQKGNEN